MLQENKKEEKQIDIAMTKASYELPYWKMTKSDLLKHFDTDQKGYSDEKAKELLEKFGPNELNEKEDESILEKIMEQFEDILVRILLLAAIISFIIAVTGNGEEGFSAYVEPFVILLILIANATIGVWQDLNADKAIEALKKLQATSCNVYRGGVLKTIDSKDLIPGDIISLNEGEKVPADTRIIDVKSSTFQVNESSLTGEAVPVYKEAILNEVSEPGISDHVNIAFSSCGVVSGHATGIVIATAMKTQIGQIQDMIIKNQEEEEKTPLKIKLEEFGEILTKIIGAICIVVWIIHYRNFFDDVHGSFIKGMIYYFKISVALAVAAIPEGLPAVITTCLALGTRRLSKNKAIIRKLHSIETLGCTTVICSDKTGTLTTNNMTVSQFLVFKNENIRDFIVKEVTGTSFNPEGEIKNFSQEEYKKTPNLRYAAVASALCNTSTLVSEDNVYSVIGSSTEGALRVFVEKLGGYDGFSYKEGDAMKYNNYLGNEYEILHTLEFDRDRKCMSVIVLDKKNNKLALFTKGAVEYVINNSAHYLDSNGKVHSLNDTQKTEIHNLVEESFTKRSLRTLGVSMNTIPNEEQFRNIEFLKNFFKSNENVRRVEKDSTLLGMFGMLDPPRPEVGDAIKVCQQAGIRVIMITGDNKTTAEAIGKDIGIIEKHAEGQSFVTREFFNFDETKQLAILQTEGKLIFSRSEPRHKMQLVKLLKKLGFIVAMTGDGVNDAPALSEANIGVAMGITGTDVAKEAAHMVLADDNFATIVKAIEEGRSIYMNMKAFIRYLISSNIGEVVSIFLTSIFGLPEAFTSIQLLWVNLVTDGPPATALGFNPPEKNIMSKPPRNNDEPLLTKWVIIRYFIIGTYVGLATIGIFVYWYLYFNHADGHSLITWDQLTHWNQCSKWETFKVNSFSGLDLSTNPCDYFNTNGKRKPVTLALTVLVVIEMFNAMNAISDESSLLVMPPTTNPWLILAVFASISLHCVILYIPFFNQIFGIAPLDLSEWALVIAFSFPVIIIEEIIKFFNRVLSKKNTKHMIKSKIE